MAQGDIRTLIAKDSLSTDYPFLYKVVLSCKVSHSSGQDFYFYDYTLINDSKNRGNIWSFEINISRHPNSVVYDTLGLEFATTYEQGQFRRNYPSIADRVESVGFPHLPSLDWSAEIVYSSDAGFDVDTLLPAPGSSVSGFSMMSKALPGIRTFTTEPYFDAYKFYPDAEDTIAAKDAIYSYVDSMKEVVNYHGWTIGPTAPPLNFSASSWIDTLVSYKHQCVTLGWLTNGSIHEKDEDDDKADEGIVERLDRRLDKAKAAIVRSDSVKARLELELFVREVEHVYHQNKEEGMRRGVPVLTSEGYALLKYNAEYLIDRLPKRHERGEDEKGKIQR
jgi:hypothetical protein